MYILLLCGKKDEFELNFLLFFSHSDFWCHFQMQRELVNLFQLELLCSSEYAGKSTFNLWC